MSRSVNFGVKINISPFLYRGNTAAVFVKLQSVYKY